MRDYRAKLNSLTTFLKIGGFYNKDYNFKVIPTKNESKGLFKLTPSPKPLNLNPSNKVNQWNRNHVVITISKFNYVFYHSIKPLIFYILSVNKNYLSLLFINIGIIFYKPWESARNRFLKKKNPDNLSLFRLSLMKDT